MDDHAGATQTASDEKDATACIARARAMIPLLRSAVSRIDDGRELPRDVLDAMHDAGSFKLLLPRSCGGYELRPNHYIQCVEAIAEGKPRLPGA